VQGFSKSEGCIIEFDKHFLGSFKISEDKYIVKINLVQPFLLYKMVYLHFMKKKNNSISSSLSAYNQYSLSPLYSLPPYFTNNLRNIIQSKGILDYRQYYFIQFMIQPTVIKIPPETFFFYKL